MEELANFLIYSYLDMDLRMQKCKYCGRYFGVADNYRSEYCNRLIKNSTKTCKELGSVKLYEQKLMENPAVREYKRSYKSHNSRVRYGSMTKEEFFQMIDEAKQEINEGKGHRFASVEELDRYIRSL